MSQGVGQMPPSPLVVPAGTDCVDLLLLLLRVVLKQEERTMLWPSFDSVSGHDLKEDVYVSFGIFGEISYLF